ncbi:hypothetical protein ACE1TI_06380 [Alteribacillus sp. JSM 102045]|uniref:hypothetical protein n=1 Tax=Alteribacillus sp. JSM 102045 TaxID=1562101 RepID=UPI0035C26F19
MMDPQLKNSIHLDTSFLLWLNKQSGGHQEEWILDGFLFVLKKLSLHEQIRLDRDRHLHQRFWKGMEQVFQRHLLTKSKKPKDVFFYQFIETIAEEEGWIKKGRYYASITQSGREFLHLSRRAQWNHILGYIWPEK